MGNEVKRSGFAVIVGRPNVGKSTLMNALIGQKIAITSPKPQTTRNKIRTVYTSDKGQIVFLDTPGVIEKAKNRLGEYMQQVSSGSLADADVILYLVEPSSFIGEGDRNIIAKLKGIRTPVLLVISKADTVRKEEVLPVIEAYRRMADFKEIIPVSALKDTNLDELIDTVYRYLPEGPAFFDDDTVTDQPVRQIVAEIIREKSLQLLRDEIPHGIAVTIEQMQERKDGNLTDIDASIICERESHKGIIIGKNGEMLKKIGTAARYEIEDMIDGRVNLQLWVKVRKDWRDSDTLLKNFGYQNEK
ncbi:MAG: GTPase Era [Lachnospiraceae bacterium]|jgi:GTP-binding protein Era|nr:GTPase Era [Lachnospiraceae bacterium]MCI1727760.1 GTPase Era [Lachnospiraceae bacterium]